MGCISIDNRKVTEWVDNFCGKILSPFGDRIYIANINDQRDSHGSFMVWYSINDELQELSDQSYKGYLRAINAFEDSESLEQFLVIDVVAAVDIRPPNEFYHGLNEFIKRLHFTYTKDKLSFIELVARSDQFFVDGGYLDECGFFNGYPAYVNRIIFSYDAFNSLLYKTPTPTSDFDEQNKKFCEDILSIGDYLRDQFILALEVYAEDQGYEYILNK